MNEEQIKKAIQLSKSETASNFSDQLIREIEKRSAEEDLRQLKLMSLLIGGLAMLVFGTLFFLVGGYVPMMSVEIPINGKVVWLFGVVVLLLFQYLYKSFRLVSLE